MQLPIAMSAWVASHPTGGNIKENHAVTVLLRSSHKTNYH